MRGGSDSFSARGTLDGNRDQGFIITPVYPSMDLSKIYPGIAGEVNGVKIMNAPPDTKVYVVYSSKGGGAYIGSCDITQNVLQIDSPKLVGSAITNDNGTAIIKGVVPANFQGRTMLLQAVVPLRCEISNLVVQRFD